MDSSVFADKNKAVATFKAAVLARRRAGLSSSNDQLAYEVLQEWNKANEDLAHKFKHGRDGNGKTPNPNAAQPYSRLLKYLDGRQAQKISGWRICAEVLGCNLVDLIHGRSSYQESSSIAAMSRRRIFAGSAAIDGLANIEVSEPRPTDGKNRVDLDSEGRQSLSLDLRLIFNSRDDVWEDSQGGKRYVCRIVLTQARVDAEFSKKSVFLVNGIAIDGQVSTKSLLISYLGALPENQGVSWRILPLHGKTLDGVSELLYQFCELDGVFTRGDTVSISVESHWVAIASLEPEELDETVSHDKVSEIKAHIRRQILSRSLQSRLGGAGFTSTSSKSRWVLAQRDFMSELSDED